jgi:hypothetical protein
MPRSSKMSLRFRFSDKTVFIISPIFTTYLLQHLDFLYSYESDENSNCYQFFNMGYIQIFGDGSNKSI